MKIYENVIIGNFLFGLGYRIGYRNTESLFNSQINLLQQTPADKLLGDFMAKLGNKFYLIEFKEGKNRSNKELTRFHRLKQELNNELFSDLVAISKKIHWYIETSVTQDDLKSHTLISKIGPYLELDSLPEPVPNIFTQFINDIATDVTNKSSDYTPEDVEQYLNLVRKTLGGSGRISTGGLLLSVSPNGEINYIVINDIMDLRMSYEEWQDCLLQESKAIDIEKQTISHERELNSDGPDLGM